MTTEDQPETIPLPEGETVDAALVDAYLYGCVQGLTIAGEATGMPRREAVGCAVQSVAEAAAELDRNAFARAELVEDLRRRAAVFAEGRDLARIAGQVLAEQEADRL